MPKRRMLNIDVHAFRAAITAYTWARLDRNYIRAHEVINAIVGVTAGPAPADYKGDVVFDEHVIQTRYRLTGTGTRDDKDHTADLDAT